MSSSMFISLGVSVKLLAGPPFCFLLLVTWSYQPPLNCLSPRSLLFLTIPLGTDFSILGTKYSQSLHTELLFTELAPLHLPHLPKLDSVLLLLGNTPPQVGAGRGDLVAPGLRLPSSWWGTFTLWAGCIRASRNPRIFSCHTWGRALDQEEPFPSWLLPPRINGPE